MFSSIQQLNALAPLTIGLVLRNAPEHFHNTATALCAIRAHYSARELLSVDIYYEQPYLFLAVLHFDGSIRLQDIKKTMVKTPHANRFDVLDLWKLGAVEREAFFEFQQNRFSRCEVDVSELETILDQIKAQMSPAMRSLNIKPDMRMPIYAHYAHKKHFYSSYHNLVTGPLLCVPQDSAVHPNDQVLITITVGDTIGPISFSARGASAEEEKALPPNHTEDPLKLLLPNDEANILNSFLLALQQDQEWPQQSGRRFLRHPITLQVDYTDDERAHAAQALNISSGGFFVDSAAPPASGKILDFVIHLPNSPETVTLRGEVVWSNEDEANGPAGAGIRFVDTLGEVRGKVHRLVGQTETEATKRIMLVDADPFFCTVIGSTLRLAGYEVLEERDNDSAFTTALHELMQLDAVMLDIRAPGTKIQDLVPKLKSARSDSEFAVAAFIRRDTDPELQQTLSQAGVDLLLDKRQDPDLLLQQIKQSWR